MDARIVKDCILDIINMKIEIIKARGIIVANYDELLIRLIRAGYTEGEVQTAIRQLVREKQVKAGKYADGKGWIRDYRNVDDQEEI